MPEIKKDSEEHTRRKRERIYVLLLLVAIALFTGLEIKLLQLSSQLPFVNSIFFFGLMNLNIVLIMLLLFLVFRNAVKLILDERRGRIGSRLKTRLVFAFLLFAIIPTILLFSVSAFYIKNSFDSWFSARIGGTLQKSIEVVKNYYEIRETDARNFVRKIAFSLDGKVEDRGALLKKLERARIEYALDAVEYHSSPFASRLVSVHPDRRELIPQASLETLQRQFAGKNDCRVENVGVGELVRCGVSLGPGKGVLFANYFIPMITASQLSEIAGTYHDYKSNNPLGYPIKSTYFAILSMMTLLILFSAVWTGFYVARRLSVPIEELTRGTEEIANGNLDYIIPQQGGDELGRLVDSFNQMTADVRAKTQEVKKTNSDLVRINEELSYRESYIRVLLESVQSGVISLDREGKISMVNQAASDLLRISDASLVGKPYWAIIPEDHRTEFREILVSLYGNAKPLRREMRIRTRDERWLTLVVTFSVLRGVNDGAIGVVAVFDDVTEVQKMQRMSAWREVAKRIAHEIKNPLTPIQLSVQRLRRRYLGKLSDDGTFGDATDIILKEVEALKLLVNEFSAFARLPEIQQQSENLNEICLEAVNLFRAAHENISFELRLMDNMPKMELDRGQLKRVLINLFDNAVAAMNSKGTIGVTTEHVPGVGVRLSVTDDGHGISADQANQLFEPYFSTKEGGTGLGLAIAHRIVTDHGGFVRVQPNRPCGTRFVLELPEQLVSARSRATGRTTLSGSEQRA